MAGKGFTVKKNWDNPAEHQMPATARVPTQVRIGPVVVAPATVLAPMAGVTDTVFRRFIRHASLFTAGSSENNFNAESPLSQNMTSEIQEKLERSTQKRQGTTSVVPHKPQNESGALAPAPTIDAAVTNTQSGCGLLMTEFTSADGLARMRETKRLRYLTFYDDEHPIGAQLFGANPETLAEAARIVEETGFDLVDLNLGCPAKRVVGSNGGSGLLRDLPRIQEIFRAVRKAVNIPFTVKFRLGWNDANIVCIELARMAEAEGLNGLALHARTREQGYSGQARWEWIARVKQAVKIPVIGNGDIHNPEAAAAMVAETGCDAVMIGRAAPANPWIFRQIAQYTATGSYERPTVEDRYRMIRAYFQMLLDEAEATKDLPRAARHGRNRRQDEAVRHLVHSRRGGRRQAPRGHLSCAHRRLKCSPRWTHFFAAQLAAGVPAEESIEEPGFAEFPEEMQVCD